MKRMGIVAVVLSLFPLYMTTLGILDAAAVGHVFPIGPVGCALIVLFLALFVGGLCAFLFGRS